MKTLFMILFILFATVGRFNSVLAQNSCANTDFSMGDFTNWTGSVGEHTSAGDDYTSMTGMIIGTPNSSPFTAGQQTIMNAPGTDINTLNLLSVIPPGGTSSCRLGNAQVESCDAASYPQAAQLEYTIAVSNDNAMFTCQYAVVLQNPNHTTAAQPKFIMCVLDSAGTRIDSACGEYEVTAATGIPGFNTCTPNTQACDNSSNVEWKNWTSIGVDLSAYIGQKVTIEFIAFDCIPGGHFGYAYISCACSARKISVQCSADSVVLSAPAGFDKYTWSPGGDSTQFVSIKNPVNGTVYSCTCTSPPGCQFVVTDTLNYQPVVFSVNSPTICPGDSVILTATGNGLTYYWSTNQSGSSVSVSPTTNTIYTVTASYAGGCSNTSQSTVTLYPRPQTPVITQQEDSLISNAVNGNQWYYGSSSIPGANTQYYIPAVSGNYYTIVTDSNGCVSDTSNKMNIIVTGLNDISGKRNIYIYPSPATNFLTIETFNKSRVDVINMEGQLMKCLTVNEGNTTIDVSLFPSGVYVVRMETGNEFVMKKFVKE